MLRSLAILLALTTAVSAQTVPSISDIPKSGRNVTSTRPDGTPVYGPPVVTLPDLLPTFGTKADVNPLLKFLTAGQTLAQLVAGQIDATPAINSQIAATGGVSLPCGDYLIKSPIRPITADRGNFTGSLGCVRLLVDMPSGQVLTLGAASGPSPGPLHTKIGGFQLKTLSTRAAGQAAIYLGTHYNADVSDITFDGPWSDEIVVDGGNGISAITRLRNLWLGSRGAPSGACVKLINYAVDTFVSQVNSNACSTAVEIHNASGIYLDGLDLYASTQSGVAVIPGAGENVNALFASNVLADTSLGAGWFFDGTGPITDVHLTNIWGAGSGNQAFANPQTFTSASHGISINNHKLNGLTISNGHFHHNGGSGIYVLDGKNITITGGTQVWNNSVFGTDSSFTCANHNFSGVFVSFPATKVTISDTISGTGGFMGETAALPNCQKWGLDVESGPGSWLVDTASLVTVSNSQFLGNALGGVTFTGNGEFQANQVIGLSNWNYGGSQIPAGQACVIVPLGLDAGIPDPKIHFSFTVIVPNGVNPFAHGASQVWAGPVLYGAASVCGNGIVSSNDLGFQWEAYAYKN